LWLIFAPNKKAGLPFVSFGNPAIDSKRNSKTAQSQSIRGFPSQPYGWFGFIERII